MAILKNDILRNFIFLGAFIIIIVPSKAQRIKEQFEQVKQGHRQNFDEFVEQKDKEFAQFLRKNWKSFELNEGDNIERKPKPQTFPKSAKGLTDSLGVMQINNPPKLILEDELVMPVDHKSLDYSGEIRALSFPFFGDTVTIKYDTDLKIRPIEVISPESIGDFWEEVSSSNYGLLLNALLVQKRKYGLSDYGYYLLLRDCSEALFTSDNQRRLYTWFLLSKSKYKAKVGYSEDKVYLLLPSQRKIYGKKYFTLDRVTYYLMSEQAKALYAYHGDYAGAFKQLDFSVGKEFNLKLQKAIRPISFSFQNKAYTFDFTYNQNAIIYYSQVPAMALEGYFSAQLSKATRASLISNLYPIVKDMSELEAVNFLLALVQNGFEYKIDEEQFGKEKVFFPEEILFYPYSDCEDRSVFFAYLVNTLLGNEVIGLDYPSHVATAVHFEENVPGDYFVVNRKKYVVCDPTYTNAPVGASMRDLTNYTAEVITPENPEPGETAMHRIKQLLGIQGEMIAPKVLKFENGTVMAANYDHEIWVQNENMLSTGPGLLLTAFDEFHRKKWAKNLVPNEQMKLKDMVKDTEGNIIMLVETNEVFEIKKFSHAGEELWSQNITPTKPVIDNASIQVILLDTDGNQIAGKSYSESAVFEAKSLKIVENNILVITPNAKD